MHGITIGCTGSPKKPAPSEPYVRTLKKQNDEENRQAPGQGVWPDQIMAG